MAQGTDRYAFMAHNTEIGRVLETMRQDGPRLYLFRPVEDLSALAEDGQNVIAGWGRTPDQPLANELERHVLKSRAGVVLVAHSILKIDQWFKSTERSMIEGAANFRYSLCNSLAGKFQMQESMESHNQRSEE